QQAGDLGQEARRAAQLSQQAAQVEPGAAAALNHAQRAAQQGAQNAGQPSAVSTARQNVQRSLEQAETNLASRAQQLRRDRDLADSLHELSNSQQSARDKIAKAAQELEQLATPQPQAMTTSPQVAAAQSLREAQQQFATAQRATGEGAAEISGQQEVANQPIREALQIASGLNRPGGGM